MSTEDSQLQDFMDEHKEKLSPSYDPYSYVDDLYNYEPEHEFLEDFVWQYEDGSRCEF
jgi:hypothetical protein